MVKAIAPLAVILAVASVSLVSPSSARKLGGPGSNENNDESPKKQKYEAAEAIKYLVKNVEHRLNFVANKVAFLDLHEHVKNHINELRDHAVYHTASLNAGFVRANTGYALRGQSAASACNDDVCRTDALVAKTSELHETVHNTISKDAHSEISSLIEIANKHGHSKARDMIIAGGLVDWVKTFKAILTKLKDWAKAIVAFFSKSGSQRFKAVAPGSGSTSLKSTVVNRKGDFRFWLGAAVGFGIEGVGPGFSIGYEFNLKAAKKAKKDVESEAPGSIVDEAKKAPQTATDKQAKDKDTPSGSTIWKALRDNWAEASANCNAPERAGKVSCVAS